jgi:hypothetical protein
LHVEYAAVPAWAPPVLADGALATTSDRPVAIIACRQRSIDPDRHFRGMSDSFDGTSRSQPT